MAEAKLGRCPRCKAHGLVDDADGIRLAVDIAPVDALGYGVAVASGVRLWWVENTPGRPSRVLGPLSAARNPSWGPGGCQTSVQKLHAEHSCGASARDWVIVNVQRPPSAPVTPGSPRGGPHQPDAPAGATRAPERPSPAPPATRRPSEPLRCDICDQLIKRGAVYSAIECGQLVWAIHEDCP